MFTGWMRDSRYGCQYWAPPHVITPELVNLGPGRWRDESGEHYEPPLAHVPICPGARFPIGAMTDRQIGVAAFVGIGAVAALLIWIGTR